LKKRIFDIVFSGMMLLILSPLMFILALAILIDSPQGVFFGQIRVGKDGREFRMWKFRTMKPNSEKLGQLTVGARDNRITRVGFWLRKYKVDELPQLWNVFIGDMSMVGPRPEVPRYVALYNAKQKAVLSIRPGITDYASLLYFEESVLLAQSPDPESTYIHEVMPAKLQLNLDYLDKRTFSNDMSIIMDTVKRMLS
jgi:lipopolysaccharide/colanic/teichoic acid biosynthesis glycosyltransferase